MLSSSNSTVVSLPNSVMIPQGAVSSNFTVTVGNVSSSTTANLTASYSGVSTSFSLTINPAVGP